MRSSIASYRVLEDKTTPDAQDTTLINLHLQVFLSEHPGQSGITFPIEVGNDGNSNVSVIQENAQTSFY